MATHLTYKFEQFRRIPRGFALEWKAPTDDSPQLILRQLCVAFRWPPFERLYYLLVDRRRSDDDFWVTLAQQLIGRVSSLADRLTRGAGAVSQDWVTGWYLEREIMSHLEVLERECQDIQASFKIVGAPRYAKLKQANSCLHSFFKYSMLAFYWGKLHVRDATGSPGERALYETGMAKTAAVRRLTNNGSKFGEYAILATEFAAQAVSIIELETGAAAKTASADCGEGVRCAQKLRRRNRRPTRRPEV